MTYDPYPDTLEGVKLDRWETYALRHRLLRAIEQAADARDYGGPAHAQMYLDVIVKVNRELLRRGEYS